MFQWKLAGNKKAICLTFDDGPSAATPLILKILKEKNVKAVFFCLGDRIEKYPEWVVQIVSEGHQLANHGAKHQSGWTSKTKEYVKNVSFAQSEVNRYTSLNRKLFRPPYGRLTFGQIKSLCDYELVMWTLMSGDFDKKLTAEKCLEKCKRLTRSGDIVLFHDQEELSDKLERILPRYIDYCLSQGFEFKLL